MARSGRLLLGLGFSAAAAAWLVVTTDIGAVIQRVQQAQLAWLLVALPVLAAQAWIRAARWAALVSASTGRPVPPSRTLDPMLLGYFVNAVAPGRLGEVARTLVVSRRESFALSAVAASVIVERAIDVLALAGLASIALAFSGSDWSLPFAALALGIAVVVLLGGRATALGRFIPSRLPTRLADGLRGFLRSVAAIGARVSARAAALSTVAWLGDAMLVLIVARALDLDIAPAAAVAIGLGGSLGTALPAAPGYLATYELGAVTVAGFAGVPREIVLPVAILTHLVGVLVLATAGAVSLGRVSGFLRLDALLRGDRLNIAAGER